MVVALKQRYSCRRTRTATLSTSTTEIYFDANTQAESEVDRKAAGGLHSLN
jgi:hypothetical protein